MSTSSLAVARGLEALWLGGLFTAAELAAADLLLQLSVQGCGGDEADRAAASSRSTTTRTTSSPRSVSTLCGVVVEEEGEQQAVEQAVETMAMELDRRATKRYRLLSELYAATTPPSSTSAVKKQKRKRDDDEDLPGSPWPEEAAAARYGDC